MKPPFQGSSSHNKKNRYEEELHSITEIALALSREKDREKLFREILLRIREHTNSDGGALFLVESKPGPRKVRDKDDLSSKQLIFKIVQNDSLPEIERDFQEMTLEITENSLVGYSALHQQVINIEDAYHIDSSAPYSHDKSWDQMHNYRTRSILVVPMFGTQGEILGVIELVNRKTDKDQKLNSIFRTADSVLPFDKDTEKFAVALASQAAVALENQNLFAEQKVLLESFIHMIASAIDSKSPYTGAHCERVPILTEMLTREACRSQEGIFADFDLTSEQWYELKIAAWLHDCGKVTTPVHVMDKATKLESIHDRIEVVRSHYEILKRDAEINYLRQLNANVQDGETLKREYDELVVELNQELRFLEEANVGSEFLAPDRQEKIKQIAKRTVQISEKYSSILSEDYVKNLCISRGTLNEEERIIINGHMVETIKMLEALPFPSYLKRVPEYAAGHHERMDGTGYPKGIYAQDMSIPARIMAVADVFEALTARDRPYKKAKTLSEAMTIMGYMKRDNHLDPNIFDLFIRSGVYKEYGQKFLSPELIDDVDEEKLLAIKPGEYELPDEELRRERWENFLPEYAQQAQQTGNKLGKLQSEKGI